MRFNKNNVNYIIEKFTETQQFVALEDFVMIIKNTIGCDLDYLLHKLVDAHACNPDKMYDILEYIEEEQHLPSHELQSKMLNIIIDGGLNPPENLRKEL